MKPTGTSRKRSIAGTQVARHDLCDDELAAPDRGVDADRERGAELGVGHSTLDGGDAPLAVAPSTEEIDRGIAAIRGNHAGTAAGIDAREQPRHRVVGELG